MSRKNIFLILAVIGFIAPYYFFLQVRAFNLGELFQLFSDSKLLSGIAMDLLISVFVFWLFMFTEAKKLQMKHPWIYLLATLLVGLSFALTYSLDLHREQVAALKSFVRGQDYVLMSPYPPQTKPVVLTAWTVQLVIDSLPDERIEKFIAYYQNGLQNPEPGAPCSGAVGEPLQ